MYLPYLERAIHSLANYDGRLSELRKRSFRDRDAFMFRRGKMKDVDPDLGNIDADKVLWQGHWACP